MDRRIEERGEWEPEAGTLIETLRSAYIERATGHVRSADGCLHWFVDESLLYLGHGRRLRGQLRSDAVRLGTGVHPRLFRLGLDPNTRVIFERSERNPGGFTEAVRTVDFLLSLVASSEESIEGLVRSMGGHEMGLRLSVETPALGELFELDSETIRSRSFLEAPTSVGGILRAAGDDALWVLQGVRRLWLVGLARKERPAVRQKSRTRRVENLEVEVGRGLAAEPLELEYDVHRRWVLGLDKRAEEFSHYELLGLDVDCHETEIDAAYSRISRLVHPSHAERLDLPGGRDILSRLFRLATAAYLAICE